MAEACPEDVSRALQNKNSRGPERTRSGMAALPERTTLAKPTASRGSQMEQFAWTSPDCHLDPCNLSSHERPLGARAVHLESPSGSLRPHPLGNLDSPTCGLCHLHSHRPCSHGQTCWEDPASAEIHLLVALLTVPPARKNQANCASKSASCQIPSCRREHHAPFRFVECLLPKSPGMQCDLERRDRICPPRERTSRTTARSKEEAGHQRPVREFISILVFYVTQSGLNVRSMLSKPLVPAIQFRHYDDDAWWRQTTME